MGGSKVWALSLGIALAGWGCIPGGGGGGGGGGNGGSGGDDEADGSFGAGGMGGGAGGMGGGAGGMGGAPVGPGSDTYDFSSIAPADTPIGELDAQQQTALCMLGEQQIAAEFSDDDLNAIICATFGFLGGAFDMQNPVQGCQMAYDQCLGQPLMTEENPCPVDEHPDCMATLGQFEQCLNEQAVGFRYLADEFSCELVTAEEPPPGLADNGTPTCDAIEALCPGFIEDEEEF